MQALREYLTHYFFPKPPLPKAVHKTVRASGTSIDETLRTLEERAQLPHGDLYLGGKHSRVAMWPALRTGVSHLVNSKTSDTWRAKNQPGYIYGSVFVADPPDYARDHIRRMPVLVANALLQENVHVGRLDISQNCEGVFKGTVCEYCGYVQKD